MNFVDKRKWFFLFSLLVIVPGVIFLIIAPGLNPGIDFIGGSSTNLSFESEVNQNNVRIELSRLGHTDATVQTLGDGTFEIRTKELDESSKKELVETLQNQLSPEGVTVLSFDLVSPMVARETVVAALWAILFAAIGIFFYLWWAFRSVPNPFRYGVAAIIALIHDTLVVVGIFAVLGELLGIEVNTMFLIALLTVIGYSVNDTIVVFDRLRENITIYPNRTLQDNANMSISESMGRSVNTSLTLLLTLIALILFGGETIRVFLWVLMIGVIAGTYSSLGIATPMLVAWESGDLNLRRIFRRKR